jgi:tetratricopeptide (TPR) repeat protein
MPLACIVGLLLSVATFAQQSADSIRRPGLASFYYGGLMKSEEGDFNGAIAEFNHLIGLNPRDAIAYYNRGLLERAIHATRPTFPVILVTGYGELEVQLGSPFRCPSSRATKQHKNLE